MRHTLQMSNILFPCLSGLTNLHMAPDTEAHRTPKCARRNDLRKRHVRRNHSRLDHGQIRIRIGSRRSPVTVGSHPSHNQNRNRVTVESRLSQVTDGSRSDPQQYYMIDSSRLLRVFHTFRFFLRFLPSASALGDVSKLSSRIHDPTARTT